MSRILALLSALAVFVIMFAVRIDIKPLIDVPSAIIVTVLPLLFLLAIYSPAELKKAVSDLGAPPDAGVSAFEYRNSSQAFLVYGILGIATGVCAAIISVIFVLSNLGDPKIVIVDISASVIALFYSLVLFVFFCYPARSILENAARRAELFDDETA
ncbi:MAG: hypothetical protein PHD82_07650 [Candidatus Riflebacteria bacterium]|jgi:flagellar motor component MotA|nr:hypothetical protein [Candidatus Riflebacteria bacterium]